MDSNPTCVKQAMPKQAVLGFRSLFSSRSLWRHGGVGVCVAAKGTLTHVFVEVSERVSRGEQVAGV